MALSKLDGLNLYIDSTFRTIISFGNPSLSFLSSQRYKDIEEIADNQHVKIRISNSQQALMNLQSELKKRKWCGGRDSKLGCIHIRILDSIVVNEK